MQTPSTLTAQNVSASHADIGNGQCSFHDNTTLQRPIIINPYTVVQCTNSSVQLFPIAVNSIIEASNGAGVHLKRVRSVGCCVVMHWDPYVYMHAYHVMCHEVSAGDLMLGGLTLRPVVPHDLLQQLKLVGMLLVLIKHLQGVSWLHWWPISSTLFKQIMTKMS